MDNSKETEERYTSAGSTEIMQCSKCGRLNIIRNSDHALTYSFPLRLSEAVWHKDAVCPDGGVVTAVS